MRQYYNLVTYGLIILVGLSAKIFITSNTTTDGTSGPANASIWSYGTIACGIFGLMLLIYGQRNNNSTTDLSEIFDSNTRSNSSFIKILPILLLFIIVSWIISLNVIFYKKINQGYVPSEYNSYNNISLFLTIIQVLIIFRYTSSIITSNNSVSKTTDNVFTTTLTSLNYLLSISNIFLAIIATIILSYFTTDG